jgi:hypothetical protein
MISMARIAVRIATGQPATIANYGRRAQVVKFKIKIQKGEKVIEKTLTMNKDSILYFITRLEEYGWKRI